MVDIKTRLASGRPPVTYPFLLARAIGDGTVKPYLDAACGRTPHYLYRYRYRLPMSENEFLWSTDPKVGLYRLLQPNKKAVVRCEAGAIVRCAILAKPLEQVNRHCFGSRE